MTDPVAMLESQSGPLRALGAAKIGVFGSHALGTAAPGSDVDIYVEFLEGKKSFRNFNALYDFLENLYQTRIDLVTDGALEPRKARIILPTVRYASLAS